MCPSWAHLRSEANYFYCDIMISGELIMNYVVNLILDPEAGVWIATSDDIPGLVLESGSFVALLERVRFAVPELLELNDPDATPLTLTFQSERRERIMAHD